MTIPDWLVVFVWALLAVSLLSTDARLGRWRKRAEDAERTLALRSAGPASRPGRCPHVVETTALVSCDLPEGHAGPCRCGELDAWRAR